MRRGRRYSLESRVWETRLEVVIILKTFETMVFESVQS